MGVWFVRDGCGIACVIIAWLLMAFSQYALLVVVLKPQTDYYKKYLHIIFFEFFFCLALVAHLRTIFTDPGCVPKKNRAPELMQELGLNSIPNRVVYECSECCSVKPDRAHHCSVCKRCIMKMDHHCPWVNNCVGQRNQKYFVLFTLYVTIISFQALFLSVNHFVDCVETDWQTNSKCPMLNKGGRAAPENLIILVFLTFEALLFALFTTIMLSIQMKAIWSDWTGIESLKKENRGRVSGCRSIKSVFGDNILLWMSPFTSVPSKDMNSQQYAASVDATASNSNCPV